MLELLGPATLGAWLVLLSVFQWVTFLDLGVASGARNVMARALANGDLRGARQALVTGWIYTLAIVSVLATLVALALLLTPVLGWLENSVFKGQDVASAVWLVCLGACGSFVLSYILAVFAAFQKAASASVFAFAVNLIFLGALYIVPLSSSQALLQIGVMYLVSMLLTHVALITQFFMQHPNARFRLSDVDHSLRRKVVGFGIRLFVIQLAAMVIFTSSRLLVSLLFSAADVVVYDAGFRIFAVITMIHTLVMSTLWSSFTHAWEQGDTRWIRRTINLLCFLMIPLIITCGILAGLSPWIVAKWLSQRQVGSVSLYAWFAVVTVLSCWSNIFAYVLNGIGDVSLQFRTAVAAALVNLPASFFFSIKLNMGISGILAGTVLSLSVFSLLGPRHVFNVMRDSRKMSSAAGPGLE